MDAPSNIDAMLDRARPRLARVEPSEAWRRQQEDAVIVDIRPEASRRAEGSVPGAVVLERTVLEWRLDPASDARVPWTAYDVPVILMCNEGYSSSLAAAVLQELGLRRATDLIGGYRAWLAAGLPTVGGAPQAGDRRRCSAAIAW